MLLELSAPVVIEPLVARLPAQAPEEVHRVAPVEDQLTVASPPLGISRGLAAMLTATRDLSAVAAALVVSAALPWPLSTSPVRAAVVSRTAAAAAKRDLRAFFIGISFFLTWISTGKAAEKLSCVIVGADVRAKM